MRVYDACSTYPQFGVLLNGVEASVGGYMKQNFREFHEYSGPERRKADRSKLARSNGSNGSPASQSSSVTVGQDESKQDAFGEVDIDDTDEDNR